MTLQILRPQIQQFSEDAATLVEVNSAIQRLKNGRTAVSMSQQVGFKNVPINILLGDFRRRVFPVYYGGTSGSVVRLV